MNWLAIAVAVSMLSASSAYAADIIEPTAPTAFSWTGFYVGAQGGYSRFDSTVTYTSAPGTEGRPSPRAFTLGGQAGYRYEFDGGLVMGIEGDVYSDFNKNAQALTNLFPFGVSMTVDYGGSLRGQVGYAFDRFLPYVTGGVAFVHYSGGTTIFSPAPIQTGTEFAETKAGWTVGAGVAYAVTDHLVANIDYRYSDYGSTTFVTPFIIGNETTVNLKENAVKFALSYKF
jgi:outer membrane immunogenic protein